MTSKKHEYSATSTVKFRKNLVIFRNIRNILSTLPFPHNHARGNLLPVGISKSERLWRGEYDNII
jgi:hypothetical protein